MEKNQNPNPYPYPYPYPYRAYGSQVEYRMQSPFLGTLRVRVNRYSAVLKRYWWLLPLTISVGTAIASWIVYQMPPAYKSQGRMMMAGQMSLPSGASYTEEQEDFFGTQIELMNGSEVQNGAMARVQTLHPELPPEHVVFDVGQVPRASIFLLSVTAQSGLFAQAYLDAVMDQYIEKKRKLRLEKTDTTGLGISEEMKLLDKEMADNDSEMLEFQKQNNIGFLEAEGNDAAKYLSELNQQRSQLKNEFNLLDLLNLDQNLDRQTQGNGDSKTDTTLSNYGPIADYQKAKQQIELMKSQRDVFSHDLKPAHPIIKALDDSIDQQEALITTLRAQSVESLKNHRESLRLQIENLDSAIKEQEAKALDLSGRLSEYQKLKTKADRTKEEYTQLLTNLQNVNVTKNVDQDTITILEHASVSTSVKPGLARIFVAGIGGGLLIGLGILFLVDRMDDRISSLMELQTQFQEHLLGQIPQDKLEGAQSLLSPNDNRQALIESFRTLRSSIIFLPVEGARPKTLVVTSALPSEGKTTVASNLAITLAFSGARVLLVDADMRSGKMSALFGAKGAKGFSNILLQKAAWTDVVSMTAVPNLFILPCGPALHHTSEHLLGKVTDQFLKDVYEQFDYVLFDSPPVIILDDTLSLAPKVDATLFVIRFNKSSGRASRRALDLLNGRQVNVIGVICNGVTLSETEYNYNYNYRQYGGKYQEFRGNPAGTAAAAAAANGSSNGATGTTGAPSS